MSIATVTPAALRDLFLLLGNEDQATFVRLLAHHLTAETQFVMLHEQPVLEQHRFVELIYEEMLARLTWRMMGVAVEVVRDCPALSTAQAVEELNRRMRPVDEAYERTLCEREAARLKQARNRKPDTQRHEIGRELNHLKGGMTWSELTEHVMDNHREWVDATWPKGTERTPQAVRDVGEYVRKLVRDYRKSARYETLNK
jgi:hypothetical protein